MRPGEERSLLHDLPRLALLGLGACFILLPYVWMFAASLKPGSEIFRDSLTLWPERFYAIENYGKALSEVPMLRFLFNGALVCALILVFQMLFAVPAAYALANVVVSASTDPEGFGRVPVEAQAMGRPVVATNHGGARETVLEGRTGWLVAPGNAEALAVALATTLDLDLAARAKLAEIGRQHVLDNYTVDLMISRTLALYADLAGARHGRG